VEQQAQFEGWAIVELFGHQREIGYITTRYFGTACLFQVDVPELPEREFVLEDPQYVNSSWTPSGAKVKKKAAPARTRMLGPGSIYALNPCSEEAARLAIDKLSGREIVVLEVPKVEEKLLESGFGHDAGHGERVCEECGATPEEGHDDGCTYANVEDHERI
jgi:hypothetical protein